MTRKFVMRVLGVASMALLFVGPVSCQLSGLRVGMEIEDSGVTWLLGRGDYIYGQYATGDFWIVGPVELVGIEPATRRVAGGRVINGSMLNPTGGSLANGFDSGGRFGDQYQEDLNVAWDLSPREPLTIEPGNTIVSSISKLDPPEQFVGFSVLTVVDAPPEQSSFRPPYSGADKSMSYTAADLDFSALPQLPLIGGAPVVEDVVDLIDRPFLDFAPGWTRGELHGNEENNEHYGREVSVNVGIASLLLISDLDEASKTALAVHLVQRGIDLWGVYQDYREKGTQFPWPPDGGHSSGRKWAILFAGRLLDDTAMLGVGTTPEQFHEDAQAVYLTQEMIDATQSGMTAAMRSAIQSRDYSIWEQFEATYPDVAAREGTWDTDSRSDGYQPYEDNMLGLPEWYGAKKVNEGNADWRHLYRRCCNHRAFAGMLLSVLAMDLKDEWNNNAVFDYLHRFTTIEGGNPDPFALSLGISEVQGVPGASGDGVRVDGAYRSWVEATFDAYWSTFYSMSDWLSEVGL